MFCVMSCGAHFSATRNTKKDHAILDGAPPPPWLEDWRSAKSKCRPMAALLLSGQAWAENCSQQVDDLRCFFPTAGICWNCRYSKIVPVCKPSKLSSTTIGTEAVRQRKVPMCHQLSLRLLKWHRRKGTLLSPSLSLSPFLFTCKPHQVLRLFRYVLYDGSALGYQTDVWDLNI